MLYSVYCKWIKPDDIDDKSKYNIDSSELPLYSDWVCLGNNLPAMEVLEILNLCNSSPYADDYIEVVLPDININDKVMNIKNNKIGKVIEIDQQPTEMFNEVYLDEDGLPEKLFEFVTVDCEGEIVNWVLGDLIVINDSTY